MGSISPNGRYYAWGRRIDNKYKRFGILLIDLERQAKTIIDEDPYIFNSDRNGFLHVYAANVPSEIIQDIYRI